MKEIIDKNLYQFFENKRILVTGGSGFIGSNLVSKLLNSFNAKIFNLDKFNYSSNFVFNKKLLAKYKNNYKLLKVDLVNFKETKNAIDVTKPDLVFHLAAESHVDRSIETPINFINSNIIGTFNLLENVKNYYSKLPNYQKDNFLFHYVSTDEVFGSLGEKGKFNEESNYDPRSPYSASKASSDHLVNAWFHTYKLPVLTTNCSNNYGPRQFPEKLIPLVILKALSKEKIPIYGTGENIRDWLFVEDHIDAILCAAYKGVPGKKYCIGGSTEKTNLEVCKFIIDQIKFFKMDNFPYSDLFEFVQDRPGHDKRYAIDHSLISKELGWFPKTSFEVGLTKTISWYMKNENWCNKITNASNYHGERIGLINNYDNK